MDIILLTDPSKGTLRFRDLKRYGDGSGYGCKVEVTSGPLNAEWRFSFEQHPLSVFISSLETMDRELTGQAVLKPMWEQDYVALNCLNHGHVEVIGEWTQFSPPGQHIRFGFMSDQACLRPLIGDLRRLMTDPAQG